MFSWPVLSWPLWCCLGRPGALVLVWPAVLVGRVTYESGSSRPGQPCLRLSADEWAAAAGDWAAAAGDWPGGAVQAPGYVCLPMTGEGCRVQLSGQGRRDGQDSCRLPARPPIS